MRRYRHRHKSACRQRRQSKRKRIGQGARGVEHDVELRRLEQRVPGPDVRAKGLRQAALVAEERGRIGEAEESTHNVLCMLRAEDCEDGACDESEEGRSGECSWDGTGEFDVIVCLTQAVREIVDWRAVGEDVVRSLEIEGLLDFGVWRGEEVEEDE